jgi:L-2,4-diaminobutyrate decarboxylase
MHDPVETTPRRTGPDARALEARLRAAPHFILPDGSNREEVRALGRRFLDLTVEALADAGHRPLLPAQGASTERERGGPVPAGYEPPREGRRAEELIALVREHVLDRVMNVAHPGYVGHMDTLPGAIGAFSDMLVSALNNNMLCWEMSPVFTEMEARLLDWVARVIGWPGAGAAERAPGAADRDPGATDRDAGAAGTDSGASPPTAAPTGFLVSGGSLANLSAMLAARNVMCGPAFRERGLAAAPGPPVILASQEAHYSLDKIVNILGFGSRGLVRVATDDQLRLRPDALLDAIRDLRAHGHWPFAVVGIAGTTVTASVDPLDAIGGIARTEGLWYHVDAAYGGSLLVCPSDRGGQARALMRGIELADSVTLNPQKWLFVPKVCAGVFFRDSRRVAEAVRETFPYAGLGNGDIADPRRNVGEYTIQGTRRVDVLKLWLTLEHFGLDLLADLMFDSLARARVLADRVAREPELELMTPPQLNIVCFRYRPAGLDPRRDGEALDRLQVAIHGALGVAGPGWISIPRHRGRRWLRFVVLHPMARPALLDRILDEVLTRGREIARRDGLT